MIRFLYSLLTLIALPFIVLRLFIKSRRNRAYRLHMGERFALRLPSPLEGEGGAKHRVRGNQNDHHPSSASGIFSLKGRRHFHPQGERAILLHAVSLGESIAATPIIEHLMRAYPHHPIVLTTTTPTGRAYLQKRFGECGQICITYLPYDLIFLLKRFLKRVQPKLAIIMETEIWPNFITLLERQQVPIILANARLSEKSYRGYRLIRPFLKTLLKHMIIGAHAKEDAERLIRLGADPARLKVTGSIKFDITILPETLAEAERLKKSWGDRPIWIAASTHEGEDEIILQTHEALLKLFPALLLILVPRHPERFEKVKALCEHKGFQTVTRTSQQVPDQHTAVFLGDTTGELLIFYGLADIAFVGGSFVNVGGHNPLEPLALNKPVIFGPDMKNFQAISTLLLKHDAAIQVQDARALLDTLKRFFSHPEEFVSYPRQGERVLADNRGAKKAICAMIDDQIRLPVETPNLGV